MSVRRLSKSYISGGRDAGPKSSSFLASYSPAIEEMDLISRVSLSASAASIEFTSIPQTYQHLQCRILMRLSSGTNTGNVSLYGRFNSDSGSNYNDHYLYGGNGTVAAGSDLSQTGTWFGEAAGNSVGSNVFAASIVDVLDYASTSKYKTIRSLEGMDQNSAQSYVYLVSSLWRSTSAITSLQIVPSGSQTIAQYSTASLFGIKA